MPFLLAAILLQLAGFSVSGTVLDENRLPVPGVQITLHAAEQTLRTTTDELGRFRFENVRTGEARVDFEKSGFFKLNAFAVTAAAAPAEVVVTLNREYEMRAQVDVVASEHEVDAQQTRHEERILAHEIRENPVPGSHSLPNALTAIPGVVKDSHGVLHISGSREEDIQYVLDGFQINDPATGAFEGRINIDAVRVVDVLTGRYGAQFANAGAGVLGLQTETGDDRWRFGTTNFLPSFDMDRGIHLGNWFPRFNFSGPLQKGRAWFSNSMSLQHGFTVIRELPPGADTSHYWSGDNLLRAQYNITPTQSLQGNFLYNGANTTRTGLGPFSPAETTSDSRSRRYFVSIKDQISFRNGLLEFGVAVDEDRFRRMPQGSATYAMTPEGPRGNYFERLRSNGRRWQGRSDLTLAGPQWHGAHTIQAGLNADFSRHNQTSERHSIELRAEDASVVRRTEFIGNPSLSISEWQGGGYAQDSWQIQSGFVLQTGVRFDRNDVVNRTLFQLRSILNWVPRDSTKLSAGWGRYYQPVYPSVLAETQEQVRFDWLGNAGTPLITTFSAAPSLLQPYFETTSVEWEQKWLSSTWTSVHVMDRRQRHGLAYEDISADPQRQQFQLNSNRRDTYRSAEFQIRRTFQSDTELLVDYTYSRARSNRVFDHSITELLLAGQASGPLSWDARHRVISRGAAQTSLWNLLFSYFAEYRSGFAFSAVDSEYRLIGLPNSFRYPAYFSINGAAEKRFRFRGHEWAFRLTVINLTDHRNYNAVINNVDSPDFSSFAGGQHRAFTARIRLVGRK